MPSLDFESEKLKFLDYYSNNYEVLEAAKETYITIVKTILAEGEYPISSVIGRLKDKEESIKKFSRKYQTQLEENQTPYEIKNYITDLIALRIISLYETDISKIQETLSNEFEILEITDKTEEIESKEDSFGYKGLHLDLKLKAPRTEMIEYRRYADLKFEIQVRTIIQDAWSVLDHKIKYKKSIPLRLKRRINTLAALFELADREFFSIREATITIEQEEKKKSQTPSETEVLNAFSFLSIVQERFPQYMFQPQKVDGFVSEILKYGNLTPSTFKQEIIASGFETVNQFKDHIGQNEKIEHGLNPYTMIRHLFYLSDKTKYQRILYNDQRNSFDKWLSSLSGSEVTEV